MVKRRRVVVRRSRQIRRAAAYQRLIIPFCLNLLDNGSQGITAGQLSVPSNRPARIQWCTVRFALKETAPATTFPIMSVALRDGNGETDSRSPTIIVGPTVQRVTVRSMPGVDFDHYSSDDPVVYFNVANFVRPNVMTIVGELAMQYLPANNPTPISGLVDVRPLTRGSCHSPALSDFLSPRTDDL